MMILCHRGYWKDKAEQNTLPAFRRALDLGFGIETDLRDQNGEIVISHDLPAGRLPTLRDFLTLYREMGSNSPLALNVKADGLSTLIKQALAEAPAIENYFVFDMSVPDAKCIANNGIRFFTRQSEVEPTPTFLNAAAGVWLDQFESCWYGPDTILQHVEAGREVALVSAELHARPNYDYWNLLSDWRARTRLSEVWERLLLCTDLPEGAAAYFA